jgi:hypothetical protein
VPIPVPYALERLYQDQDHDWVADAIPAVLAWVPVDGARRQPYLFEVDHVAASRGPAKRLTLAIRWSVDALEAYDPGLRDRVKRMRSGRTAQREHVVELAGYGLALVAISVLLPGERVVDMERRRSPDLLLDMTPGALRGIEVACRSRGGWAGVRAVRREKTAELVPKKALAEAHVSVWCGWPRVTEFCRVKP